MSVEGVVLVHGGMCTSTCWDLVMPHLALPAVAVDLPGRAGHPADLAAVTLDDCVDAVIGSADEAGFERFALIGHSLGGVTVTETAWRNPQRVTHLLYVGALIPGPGSCAAIIQTGADWPSGELVTIEEGIAKAIFGNDLSDEQWSETWQTFVPDAGNLMNARLSGYPDRMPITYVSMTDDVPVPPALVKQMTAPLGSGVEHRVLPGGHMAMVSRPQELAAIINDVLARHESPTLPRAPGGTTAPLAT
ncbi:alpha/beta fold hydrolase [Mycolicibacterium elephantis]|uniref:alpha/beta fold hydrolase n=1 Tax=Mycolicibacterium elephantis TaxID=81858 RepID=UPI000AB42A41|nr:alpha/beta hydrolase [Mycolicibacterium elephantis]